MKLDSSNDARVVSSESLEKRDGAWVAIFAGKNTLRANGELVGGDRDAAKVSVEVLWSRKRRKKVENA